MSLSQKDLRHRSQKHDTVLLKHISRAARRDIDCFRSSLLFTWYFLRRLPRDAMISRAAVRHLDSCSPGAGGQYF
jgi:hypothetical protein